jgi:aminoglycoside 2'-N-acetyltransferase I
VKDLDIKAIAELTEPDREEIRALSRAVYPPDETREWPGRHIEWDSPRWCVRLWDEGGELVSYTGVILRDGALDDEPVVVGGIGGVMTHPEARRHGHAGRCIARAVAFFVESGAGFGLLVCAPRLLGTYGKLGWHVFGGRLDVLQRGEREAFTFNEAMVIGAGQSAPEGGVIDLKGPPW